MATKTRPKTKTGPKTPDQRERLKTLYIEKLIECGGIATAACAATGVSFPTIEDWSKKDAEFAKAIQNVDEVAVGRATSMLWDSMKEGNATSIIFYLKTRGSKYGFKENQQIDLNTDIPKGMSKEQAKDFVANLNK